MDVGHAVVSVYGMTVQLCFVECLIKESNLQIMEQPLFSTTLKTLFFMRLAPILQSV